MKSFEVVMIFENHVSAVDVSIVTRKLRFRCCNVFEALKHAYDYMYFSNADGAIFPRKIEVSEVF